MDGFPSGQRGQTVNLLSSTSVVRIHPHPFFICFLRGLSSAGRAPALQAGGHRFEPCRPHFTTNIAGWSSPVARWAHNPEVDGSNPSPAMKRAVRLVFSQVGRLAQMVEHLTFNQGVGSSSLLSLIKKRILCLGSSVGRAMD